MKNIIKKITINIGGIDVNVTPEEAKNLHEALGNLLGLDKSPIIIKEKEYIPYQPYTWPYTPYWYSSSKSSGGYTIQYSQTTGDVKLNV